MRRGGAYVERQIHEPAARDRGGRHVQERVALHDDGDRVVELHRLAVRQRELFVVVKHGVEVLHPHGVDWSIEHPTIIVTSEFLSVETAYVSSGVVVVFLFLCLFNI